MSIDALAAPPRQGQAVDHDTRRDNVQFMADNGESAVGAAGRLGLSREGLEQWCRKQSCTHLFARLAARDPLPLRKNQHDE